MKASANEIVLLEKNENRSETFEAENHQIASRPEWIPYASDKEVSGWMDRLSLMGKVPTVVGIGLAAFYLNGGSTVPVDAPETIMKPEYLPPAYREPDKMSAGFFKGMACRSVVYTKDFRPFWIPSNFCLVLFRLLGGNRFVKLRIKNCYPKALKKVIGADGDALPNIDAQASEVRAWLDHLTTGLKLRPDMAVGLGLAAYYRSGGRPVPYEHPEIVLPPEYMPSLYRNRGHMRDGLISGMDSIHSTDVLWDGEKKIWIPTQYVYENLDLVA